MQEADTADHIKMLPDWDKIMIGAVVSYEEGLRGRIRPNVIASRGRDPRHAVVGEATAPGTLIVNGGNTAYSHIQDRILRHPDPEGRCVRKCAEPDPPYSSLLKRWSMGVHHGLRHNI